ncbi:flavodoxin-dependent (E)-4-hydroxy-3-methylbut-2-enyl-diphosphate synthase [Candidatus Pacearchaeota archaeon]|nr:flavodoxin-dependent (E)-4-hydroxy-3-methylbut-2-enyl-diphosphate synthase [Candidatus Pacearchaeota archaeon]
MEKILRKPTRKIKIGSTFIGNGNPIAVQGMTSTKTQNIDETIAQIKSLKEAGADIIRIAVDSKEDAYSLMKIRENVDANLSVDLQENYGLAKLIAPYVDKIRYNPGHLYHHEKEKPWQEKVKFIASAAADNDCAIRIGINCGSVDPEIKMKYLLEDTISPMIESSLEHCLLLDNLGFTRYCVSLKDSDPQKVIELNRKFSDIRPEIPLHLGVTEAGMPPDGIIKTRIALEQLISRGIGDTIRVSLTLPNSKKSEEIEAGRQIINDIMNGRVRTVVDYNKDGLNLISCPSCSRVENENFVDLAKRVEEATKDLKKHKITIATMGCRVNGPGETDHADIGLWCGPKHVNLKVRGNIVGSFSYEEILIELRKEIDKLIERDS